MYEFDGAAGPPESGHDGIFIENLADYPHEEPDLPVSAGPRRKKVVFCRDIVDIEDSAEIAEHVLAAGEMHLHAAAVAGRVDVHQMTVYTARREVSPRESARDV